MLLFPNLSKFRPAFEAVWSETIAPAVTPQSPTHPPIGAMSSCARTIQRRDAFRREEAVIDAYSTDANYMHMLPAEIVSLIVKLATVQRGTYRIVKACGVDNFLMHHKLKVDKNTHPICWRFLCSIMQYDNMPVLCCSGAKNNKRERYDTSQLSHALEQTGVFRCRPMRWYSEGKGRYYDHQIIVFESSVADATHAEQIQATLCSIFGTSNMKHVHVKPCYDGPMHAPGKCVGVLVFFMGRYVDVAAVRNDIVFQAYSRFAAKSDIRITALESRHAGYTMCI